MRQKLLWMIAGLVLVCSADEIQAIVIRQQGIMVTVSLSPKDIQELGQHADRRIRTQYKVYLNPVYTKRIAAITKEVNNQLKYPVVILDTPEVNAFCAPDHRIYVARGLMDIATDEELFFAIAHEDTHGTFGDPEEFFKETLKVQLGFQAAGIGGGLGGILAKLGMDFTAASYSRDKERRADYWAARELFGRRGNVQAAISLLEKFKKLRGSRSPQGLGRYFASHPPEEKRIKLITGLIPKFQREKTKLKEEERRRAAKPYAYPQIKVLVVIIARDESQKPPQTVVGDRMVSNMMAILEKEKTYPFVDYGQITAGKPFPSLVDQLRIAKQKGFVYLIRLEALRKQFQFKHDPVSDEELPYWEVNYRASIYRVADSQELLSIKRNFQYKGSNIFSDPESFMELSQSIFRAQMVQRLVKEAQASKEH